MSQECTSSQLDMTTESVSGNVAFNLRNFYTKLFKCGQPNCSMSK